MATVRGIAADKSGVSQVHVNQLNASVDEHGNFLQDVPIQIGTNTILVEAADSLGNRSSLSVTVERERVTLPEFAKIDFLSQFGDFYEKSLAVVVGINSYEKWPALEFAVNDAKAVRQRLIETGFGEITTIFI